MGIKKILRYTALPALIGATAGHLAQGMGYDINAVEGMKQLILAGLPTAILFSTSTSEEVKSANNFSARHPYATPLLGAGVMLGLYSLGGLGIEWLSNKEMNVGFIGAVGALEGFMMGAYMSAREMDNQDKIKRLAHRNGQAINFGKSRAESL